MEGEFLKLRDQFGIKVAVETGTCYGSTAVWLGRHFERVCTIENNKALLDIAIERLKAETNVMTVFGHSEMNMVPITLSKSPFGHVGNDTLFFLDAHFEDHCPLLDELKAIEEAGIKPVIVVHDFQVPFRPDLGFDTWNGQPFRFSWIRPSLDAIYRPNKWNHYYNHQATGAKRGVIYIHPLP